MKKLKNILNSFEEKYLFGYGKRSWQILSLLFLGFLAYAIVLYLWNATPTFRNEVTISKIEFDRNRIDTDFDINNDIEKSTLADYNKALDSLKKAMPKSEWLNLGDSVMRTEYEYQEREMYNPYWGEYYTDYIKVPYTYKVFERNEDAIPNILDDVYGARAIDSAQFLEKIKVLRMTKELISLSDKNEATMLLKNYFKGFLEYPGLLDYHKIKDIAKLYEKVGKRPRFKDPSQDNDDWDEFSSYMRICREDSITNERFQLAENAILKLKSKVNFKEKEQVHSVAKITLGSNLKNEDLSKSIEDFFGNKDFKITEKNASEVYGKYHYLFVKKTILADQILDGKKFEKSMNRSDYYYKARTAFMAILGIAAILILFSIRKIIKDRKE